MDVCQLLNEINIELMEKIQLNEQNSFTSFEEVKKIADQLSGYLEYLRDVVKKGGYESDEASLNLVDDERLFERVREVVAVKKTPTLKYVIVVGIGGSNLGTYAIYNALFGAEDAFVNDRFPKMLFADTVSASLLDSLRNIIEKQVADAGEILINVISKSGTTTESIANFEILYDVLAKRFENAKERVVVTTDEHSRLWDAAMSKEMTCLALPKKVGGRYSVFSAVGLFPLALAGVDVASLVRGAKEMRDHCVEGNNDKLNPALLSASLTYYHSQKGISIHNTFFFNPELEMVGKWYRQLMGESIGKEKDTEGRNVHAGITPIVSIGSTDLHSMAQLYFGGPRDKFANFVYARSSFDVQVPETMLLNDLVDGIAGKSVVSIMDAIVGGVKKAYQNNELPYLDIVLSKISEETLGAYLQFRMVEMMLLAKLMNVNAFDQPNVEDYKVETRKILLG